MFFVLFIRFLVQMSASEETPAVKGQHFMDILIVTVTVIVVAIPGKSFPIFHVFVASVINQ